MRRHRLWVQADAPVHSIVPLVEAALEGDASLEVDNALIDVLLDPYVRLEKASALRDLWIADAGTNLRVAIVAEPLLSWVSRDDLKRFFIQLPYGAYTHESLLMRASQDTTIYDALKTGLATVLNTSLITTLHVFAEANMNVSIAAKRMHVHRNTMMYRLDQVEQLTGINPRVFDGLTVFRTLFSR